MEETVSIEQQKEQLFKETFKDFIAVDSDYFLLDCMDESFGKWLMEHIQESGIDLVERFYTFVSIDQLKQLAAHRNSKLANKEAQIGKDIIEVFTVGIERQRVDKERAKLSLPEVVNMARKWVKEHYSQEENNDIDFAKWRPYLTAVTPMQILSWLYDDAIVCELVQVFPDLEEWELKRPGHRSPLDWNYGKLPQSVVNAVLNLCLQLAHPHRLSKDEKKQVERDYLIVEDASDQFIDLGLERIMRDVKSSC